ncbi:MAG: hypothetical protein ACRYGM_22530, partial [Janthinobacterium lividum]
IAGPISITGGGGSTTGTTTPTVSGGGGTGAPSAVYLTGVVTQTATTTTLAASDGHTYSISTSALTAAQMTWLASLPALQAEADAAVAKNTAQDSSIGTLSALTAAEAARAKAAEAALSSSVGTLTTAEAHLASLVTLSTAAPFAYPDGSGALRAGTVLPASIFQNGTLDLTSLMGTSPTSTTGTSTSGTGTSTGGTSTTGTGTSTGGTTTASAQPPMPALGTTPSAAAAPPTAYQTKFATNGSGSGSTFATASSLTIPLNPLTAGSNIVVLVGGGDQHATISGPSGLTVVQNGLAGNNGATVLFGPSSALGSAAVTLSGLTGLINVLVRETAAQGCDVTVGGLAGAGTTALSYTTTAADPASADALVLVTGAQNGALVLGSGSPIATFPGGVFPNADGTSNTYVPGIGFQVPHGSTSAIALTSAAANMFRNSFASALTVNLYAAVLAGGIASATTPVVLHGVPVVPAVLPAPAGGVNPTLARELADIAAGRKPRFQLRSFGASGGQGSLRAAKFSLAMGFGAGKLDFTQQDTWANIVGSVSYNAISAYQQGFRGNRYCISIMPIDYQSNYGDAAIGAYDTYYTQMAQALVAAGLGKCAVRPGWELEDDYYAENINTMKSMFVAAQKRMKHVMGLVPGFSPIWEGEAVILVQGNSSSGDPTQWLQGASFTHRMAVDAYITANADSAGQFTNPSQTRINAIIGGFFSAYTSSMDWADGYAISYGAGLAMPEFAFVGLRNDGNGVGDCVQLMQAGCNYVMAHNIVSGGQWEDNGGGTISNIGPQTKLPGSSLFPLSFGVYRATFGSPAPDLDNANGVVPQAPGMALSSTGGALTITSTKTRAADVVNHTYREVCLAGTNHWVPWNDVSPDTTVSSNSIPGEVDQTPPLPAAPTSGDYVLWVRTADVNESGISPWTHQVWDMTSNAAGGAQVSYPSTFGLNADGSYGPTLSSGEILPTGVVGAGAPTTATKVQDVFAIIPANAAPSVAFAAPPAAGTGVVALAFGTLGGLNALTAPAGWVKHKDALLGGFGFVDQWAAVFSAPAEAMNGGATVTFAGSSTEQFGFYAENSTGTWFEYVAQPGAFGAASGTMAFPMTATSGGADRFAGIIYDVAGAPTGATAGSFVYTTGGLTSSGQAFHGGGVLTLPPTTAGTEIVSCSSLLTNPAYVLVNLYTANPGGNAVKVGTGAAAGTTGSTTGTSTTGTTTPKPAPSTTLRALYLPTSNTSGTVGAYTSTPAVINETGINTLEYQALLAPLSPYGGTIAGLWTPGSSTTTSSILLLTSAGALNLVYRDPNGNIHAATSTANPAFSGTTPLWVSAFVNESAAAVTVHGVSVGTGQVAFFSAPVAGTATPTVWTQMGSTVTSYAASTGAGIYGPNGNYLFIGSDGGTADYGYGYNYDTLYL